MNNEQYMQLALVEARQTKQHGNLPFGAVIVKDDKVIGQGASREVSEQDVTAHAELQALRMACQAAGRDLSGATIYCSGEPCNMCASAIFHAKIQRIVIGASRSDLPQIFRKREIGINELAKDSSYKPVIERGVLRDEAIALFRD